MASSNFMNGVPELLVLRLLEAREMYGYELVQAIRTETGNTIRLGEGVVYPALHSLEKEGALKSRRKTIGGRTRVYYSVSPRGRARLVDLAAHWNRIANVIRPLLEESNNVPARI